jgi:hypothetical protein
LVVVATVVVATVVVAAAAAKGEKPRFVTWSLNG